MLKNRSAAAVVKANLNPLFATTLVACLAENRLPTELELNEMADRIGLDLVNRDGGTMRNSDRDRLIRAARLALCGDDRAMAAPRPCPRREAGGRQSRAANRSGGRAKDGGIK